MATKTKVDVKESPPKRCATDVRGALPTRRATDVVVDVSSEALDARRENVAILDAQGVIVMVNAAWRAFSLANSALPGQMTPNTEVGASYLDAAERHGDGSEGADKAASGIRAVLSGRLDAFSLTYPCHTPHEQRWFTMTVTPVLWAGERAVLVAHANTTPRHRLQGG